MCPTGVVHETGGILGSIQTKVKTASERRTASTRKDIQTLKSRTRRGSHESIFAALRGSYLDPYSTVPIEMSQAGITDSFCRFLVHLITIPHFDQEQHSRSTGREGRYPWLLSARHTLEPQRASRKGHLIWTKQSLWTNSMCCLRLNMEQTHSWARMIMTASCSKIHSVPQASMGP